MRSGGATGENHKFSGGSQNRAVLQTAPKREIIVELVRTVHANHFDGELSQHARHREQGCE
jgi:hypothetical protein